MNKSYASVWWLVSTVTLMWHNYKKNQVLPQYKIYDNLVYIQIYHTSHGGPPVNLRHCWRNDMNFPGNVVGNLRVSRLDRWSKHFALSILQRREEIVYIQELLTWIKVCINVHVVCFFHDIKFLDLIAIFICIYVIWNIVVVVPQEILEASDWAIRKSAEFVRIITRVAHYESWLWWTHSCIRLSIMVSTQPEK